MKLKLNLDVVWPLHFVPSQYNIYVQCWLLEFFLIYLRTWRPGEPVQFDIKCLPAVELIVENNCTLRTFTNETIQHHALSLSPPSSLGHKISFPISLIYETRGRISYDFHKIVSGLEQDNIRVSYNWEKTFPGKGSMRYLDWPSLRTNMARNSMKCF